MARRKGAQIFCGATVLKLERLEEPRPERPLEVPRRGWKLHVVHTDPDLRRRGRPCELVARRVILAAGTFGSTEILLRSRSSTLRFSRCLGQRFSTNGDLLAVAYNQRERVNAVALETDAFCKREIGPTITGMIDQREHRGRSHPGICNTGRVAPPVRREFRDRSYILSIVAAWRSALPPQWEARSVWSQ